MLDSPHAATAMAVAEESPFSSSRRSAPPVFDTRESVEQMSRMLPREGSLPAARAEVAASDLFSMTAQSSWRAAFSTLSKMSSDWLRSPKRQAMKMKSEREHREFSALLLQVHEKWVQMNGQSGRWS